MHKIYFKYIQIEKNRPRHSSMHSTNRRKRAWFARISLGSTVYAFLMLSINGIMYSRQRHNIVRYTLTRPSVCTACDSETHVILIIILPCISLAYALFTASTFYGLRSVSVECFFGLVLRWYEPKNIDNEYIRLVGRKPGAKAKNVFHIIVHYNNVLFIRALVSTCTPVMDALHAAIEMLVVLWSERNANVLTITLM